MNIGIVLAAVLLPPCLALVLSVIQKSGIKVSNKMTDENFVVMLPNAVFAIGAMCTLGYLVVLLGFTFLSDERPQLIFYVVFGLFIWLGVYLMVKTLTFRVVVKGKNITVFSPFRRPYSFTFSEIVSAVLKVKRNQLKSEGVLIKTTTGKRVLVESSEISYRRIVKKIQLEVDDERLVGFPGRSR